MPAVIFSQAISASVLILQLRGIGVAFANEIIVEPLLGDALELSEEMKLGRLSPGSRHCVRANATSIRTKA